MFYPHLSAPAELRRTCEGELPAEGSAEQVVARGPLLIMAYALVSLPDAEQAECRITSGERDYSAVEAAALLDHWSPAPAES